MELELGLKRTRTRDNLTADLRIAKNGGIVFLSRETEAVLLITAHLQGYRANDIYIKINEDGTEISVFGLRGFGKVFRIPEGVVLDRIKAKVDEEQSVLTISMPKSAKGISGSMVEEIVEGAVEETKPTEQNIKETEQVLGDTVENEDRCGWRKKGKVNVPAVAGSAILVSVIVLVVNMVRTRRSKDFSPQSCGI